MYEVRLTAAGATTAIPMGREVNDCPCELPSRGTTTTAAAAAGITRRNQRYPVEEAGAGDPDFRCSGKSCRSCTARVIADCVAVCCCPCAVVNIFTLTFFKVPWMLGRKCLGLNNKKKKGKLKNDEKLKGRNVISRKDEGEERKSENLNAIEEQEENSARFEAEKVWLELNKIDQLGFGRVSSTGNQSPE